MEKNASYSEGVCVTVYPSGINFKYLKEIYTKRDEFVSNIYFCRENTVFKVLFLCSIASQPPKNYPPSSPSQPALPHNLSDS